MQQGASFQHMQTPTLRLNVETWKHENAAEGRDSGRARAAITGIDHSVVSRIENGSVLPSNRFIAAVKLAFPRRSLDHFFEAGTEDSE